MTRRRAAGRPLRPNRRKEARRCERCGAPFEALVKSKTRYCSTDCWNLQQGWNPCRDLVHVGSVPKPVRSTEPPVTVVASPRWWARIVVGPCAWCGESMTVPTGNVAHYCSRRCARKANKAGRSKFMISPVARLRIYERDGFECQICHEPTEPDAEPGSDWYPTLDHVIPRSQGGSDDPSNLRTAHHWCNAVRGDLSHYTDADLIA